MHVNKLIAVWQFHSQAILLIGNGNFFAEFILIAGHFYYKYNYNC